MTTTLNHEYLHESSCGLQDDDSLVNDRFIDVLQYVVDNAEFDVIMAACGCGSCFHTNETGAVFWVAQGDSVESMFVKYDHESPDHDDMYLAELIGEAAGNYGVPVSIPPDSSYTAVLGVQEYYTDIPVGTRVRKSRHRGKGKTGTVLDADWFNDYDTPYVVRNPATGETVGKYPTREEAEKWADFDGSNEVRHARVLGNNPGENIVLYDGDESPNVVRTPDLEVI